MRILPSLMPDLRQVIDLRFFGGSDVHDRSLPGLLLASHVGLLAWF
jgi:hypothetical protein